MPVIVALAIRSLIQFAITLGIVDLAERYALPLINSAIEKIMTTFGVPEETAKDIMANEVLQFAESVGVGALALRTKLPTKIAERLGFSAKGFGKRKLNPEVEAKVKGTATQQTVARVASAAEIEQATEAIAKAKGISVAGVRSLFQKITDKVGSTAIWFIIVGNFLDFGNWEGAYQGTFQKLFSYVGIEPDKPVPKASTISDDVWKRIYSTVEELNPQTVAFPWIGEIRPYSRKNLADAVDHFAANLSATGIQANFKNVFALLLPTIKINPTGSGSGSLSGLGGFGTGGSSTTGTKVFTGLVGQGMLTSAPSFIARPDDLIESAAELKTAAENNLSAYLVSLPGKVVYQISVVASVTTKDGFTQRGQARQIQVGTYTDGRPKFKTVVNKFAVADIFILNDKGGRTKLTRIVLGPTDAVKFKPVDSDLAALENSLKKDLVTSDISKVQNVTSAPTAPIKKVDATGVFTDKEKHYDSLYRISGDSLITYAPYQDIFTPEERVRFSQDSDKFAKIPARLAQKGVDIAQFGTVDFIADMVQKYQGKIRGAATFEQFFGSAPLPVVTIPTASGDGLYQLEKSSVPSGIELIFYPSGSTPNADLRYPGSPDPQPTQEALARLATNLLMFYTATGKTLPPVSARAALYEQLGLGQAAYYTGTTEQNLKLLTSLQGR